MTVHGTVFHATFHAEMTMNKYGDIPKFKPGEVIYLADNEDICVMSDSQTLTNRTITATCSDLNYTGGIGKPEPLYTEDCKGCGAPTPPHRRCEYCRR